MQALSYVGMEDLASRSFSTLSGGEKQRVLIARSLAQEADILLLDEPTNHLDVHYQWLLMDIISGLNKTVLSVFHELNLACRYCDYLYVLKDGRIAACGPPEAYSACQEFVHDPGILPEWNLLRHIQRSGNLSFPFLSAAKNYLYNVTSRHRTGVDLVQGKYFSGSLV